MAKNGEYFKPNKMQYFYFYLFLRYYHKFHQTAMEVTYYDNNNKHQNWKNEKEEEEQYIHSILEYLRLSWNFSREFSLQQTTDRNAHLRGEKKIPFSFFIFFFGIELTKIN